jgi:FlaA1/EpsC-like NDP-sugar epimerase
MRKIVLHCKDTGKKYKTVPGFNELFDKKITVATIRNVAYSDLLGRQEVKLDMNSIDNMLNGKRILITGAGGSIGSELVRQCLHYEPSEIICLDFSEENIFNLEQDLKTLTKNSILRFVLSSVKNRLEIQKVFSDFCPQIIFHAAAYKHVPIQEMHPWNAVMTNIEGTLNMIELSDQFKSEKFILVSTDKAVNPVNVMGATKRAAEHLVQSMNSKSKTDFMAVRFGNVLGSSGSAIPVFESQIRNGGPVTITHPEMTRYFMSIQEASQLILQCGALGNEGEIFLLDMGKPIKILQMAKDLIRLSGLEPEKDIPIVFTGLRPGEKLYEELQQAEENRLDTTHKKIMILKSNKISYSWEKLNKKVLNIISNSKNLNIEKIEDNLKSIVPSYNPSKNRRDSQNKYGIHYKDFKAEA